MSTENFTGGFRTSFSGYNKDDVTEYILKENENFKAREAEYEEQIEKLKEQLASNPSSDDTDGRLASLRTENLTLKNEIAMLRQQLKDHGDQVRKQSKLSELGVKVDEIFKFTVKEAGRILEEAKTLGAVTQEKIAENTEFMKSEIQQRSEAIIAGIKKQIDEEIAKDKIVVPPEFSHEEAGRILDEVKTAAHSAREDVSEKKDNTVDTLEFPQEEAERILDEAKTAALAAREELSKSTEFMKNEIQQRSDQIIASIKEQISDLIPGASDKNDDSGNV